MGILFHQPSNSIEIEISGVSSSSLGLINRILPALEGPTSHPYTPLGNIGHVITRGHFPAGDTVRVNTEHYGASTWQDPRQSQSQYQH
jgi:hypothetical protein